MQKHSKTGHVPSAAARPLHHVRKRAGRRGKEQSMEIERKFLVRRLPDGLERYPHSRIEQAYLCTRPVVRVRRYREEFRLTCKGDGLLSREELELPLTEETYRKLLAKADGTVIEKERYRIPWEGHVIELDVFGGALAPLVFAEVEFATEGSAREFCPPDWFGREVTWEPEYSNAALSERGLPKQAFAPDTAD